MGLPGRIAAFSVAAVLVAAIVGPRLVSDRDAAPEPRAPAGPAARRTAVVVQTVAPRALAERLATTGTLRANEQIELTSEIAGKVETVRFREGSRVTAGEVLLELDDRELAAQRERAAHQLELATRREARQRQLLDDGLVSPQEYDFARTELDVLRAELALVEARLAKTSIRAPFEGVVGLRYVSPGAYLTPQTPIASLQDLDPIKLDFSVPERYADRIDIGDRVELTVAGVDDRFDAEIYAVEPVVDPATRSLVVRARRPNPGGRLRPGAFAEVSVTVAEAPAALAVPSVAIVPELGGKKVFVVEDGVARSRPVETGIRTDTLVEVVSGLAAGEQVIVSGVERVRAGDLVEIHASE